MGASQIRELAACPPAGGQRVLVLSDEARSASESKYAKVADFRTAIVESIRAGSRISAFAVP